MTAVAAPELSVAVTVKVTMAVEEPAGAATVISAGTLRFGGSPSRTIARKVIVRVPFALVAAQPTVVVPMPRVAGEDGEHAPGFGGLVKLNTAVARPGAVGAITSARGARTTGSAVLAMQSSAAWISA